MWGRPPSAAALPSAATARGKSRGGGAWGGDARRDGAGGGDARRDGAIGVVMLDAIVLGW